MLTLHVEGKTVKELLDAAYLALGLTVLPPAQSDAPPESTGEKRKPGRPPKLTSVPPIAPPVTSAPVAPVAPAAAPAPVAPAPAPTPVAPVPAPAPAPAAPSSEITHEQMRTALQKYAENKEGESGTAGMERARTLIAKYGYRKVKDIKPEHYADIVRECNV